jgi:hypothetical protein
MRKLAEEIGASKTKLEDAERTLWIRRIALAEARQLSEDAQQNYLMAQRKYLELLKLAAGGNKND